MTTNASANLSLLGRVASVAGTVVAVVVVGFLAMGFAAVSAPVSVDAGISATLLWHMAGLVVGLGGAVALIWRQRAPVPVLVATAITAILLPVGPLAPIVALPWVIAREPRRTVSWAIPLTAVSAGLALLYDALRPVDLAVLTDGGTDTPKVQLSALGYVIVWALLVGMAVLAGYLRRWRRQAGLAYGLAAEAAQHSAELKEELTRQEEREHIAREMHDTVAHHLSLLSLHAAALEVTSQDPAVPDAARSMRASAHQALEEMRGLITSLRDSAEGGYVGAPPTLADLGRLIEEARAAGVEIAATIDVEPAWNVAPAWGGGAPPRTAEVSTTVTRAVYRIVQESLTNALKHAPGSGVSVQVVGSPGRGVSVVVASWLPPHGGSRLASTGSGAGIVGMRERAAALGGTLEAGPHGQLWMVRGWLPWRT